MVGDGNADAVFAWARSDREGKQLLAKAMRGQAHDRDLSGYRDLSAASLAHRAKSDPHAVAHGIVAGGGKAKVENGKVLIDLGKEGGGWTEFTSALKGKVVRLGR
jgi:hypothetical protein